jgi:hypothetical protein
MSDLKTISEQSSTTQSPVFNAGSQLKHLMSFYVQAYMMPEYSTQIMKNMASYECFNLLADIASHTKSVEHCTIALQHTDQLSPYLKQKIANVLMQAQDNGTSMQALFKHPELINEATLAFISINKFTAYACKFLLKHNNDMKHDVQAQLLGYLQSMMWLYFSGQLIRNNINRKEVQ